MNEPVQRYDKPTIYPTMVVGVGGMGSNTVRAVKRRFRNVWGGEQLPGMIQLLALDTEPLVNRLDQEPLFADEFAYMGKFDATRLVSNLDQHPEIAQWWNYPSIPLGYIHNGAKQLRPIGRLCFFRNYVNFKQLLETKLTNLDKIRDMEIAQNRGFPVVGNFQLIYVVSSLCGGTGAGMFLDVVHRIRAQVRNNARIVGIFFLPDVLENEISSDLQRRRIRANAYAALKEMNHFQETQQFRALYPSEQKELPDTPYAPFDFIFLMGRTNRDGRSLARKSDAENMAAHLIQLTAISHLSSEILGLEVNVVRERMFELEGAAGHVTGERISRRRHFLVYSSFAASALVAPHESLVDFWQRAFVADLIRRFAAGPSLSDPRQPLPEADRQRVQNLWQTLLSHLAGRFAALDNDRLDADLEQVEEMQGAWLGFWEPIRQTMQRALMDTGIRGAIALCDLLSPPAAATALPESLARQRLFLVDGAPVTETACNGANSRPAGRRGAGAAIDGLGELAMMALSRARRGTPETWRRPAPASTKATPSVAIVDQIGKQATSCASPAQDQRLRHGLARANQDAGVWPTASTRIPDGRPSTSTYYELETGAVGRDYLQHFYRRAASAVSATDWHNALAPLFTQLLQDANAVSADDIYAQLNAATADNTGLLHRVHSMVDINHIITVQHGEEVERSRQRPDNRIHQWLDRLNPYIRWDADRFSFHESNLEHIRLAAVPTSRQEDPSLLAATVGQEDIKWVPTGDHMRMDAVWIVHGLPVTLLERLDEFRAQYENSLDFPVREEFHLNPAWADLPEITPEHGDRTPSPSLVPRPDAVPRRTFN